MQIVFFKDKSSFITRDLKHATTVPKTAIKVEFNKKYQRNYKPKTRSLIHKPGAIQKPKRRREETGRDLRNRPPNKSMQLKQNNNKSTQDKKTSRSKDLPHQKHRSAQKENLFIQISSRDVEEILIKFKFLISYTQGKLFL